MYSSIVASEASSMSSSAVGVGGESAFAHADKTSANTTAYRNFARFMDPPWAAASSQSLLNIASSGSKAKEDHGHCDNAHI
jgi:hypothetical protein